MKSYCINIPNAPNGKPSILFEGLKTITKDREIAKSIWGFTKTDLFKSEFTDLALDENGEPTLDAILNVLNIKEMVENNSKDKANAIDAGILKPNGSPAIFDLPQPAFTKAIEFNKTSKSMVAVVTFMQDNKYKVELLERTQDAVDRAENERLSYELNNTLIELVRSVGLNVSFVNNAAYNGIFSPNNARKNADGLRTVIKISNNELGWDAVPEETSHMVIAGLKDDALRQRIDADFTEDKVRRILGNEYDKYWRLYQNQSLPVDVLLREEAEGRVLADILKGRIKKENAPSGNLFVRLWQKFLAAIGKLKESDINGAIVNSNNGLFELAEKIKNGEVAPILSREDILNHPDMKSLNDENADILDILQEGEALIAKQLSILLNTGQKGNDKLLNEQIRGLRDELDKKQYQEACKRILYVIGYEVSELQDELAQYSFVMTNSTDLSVIDREAGLMNRISSAVSAFYPYIQTLKQLPQLVNDGAINLDALEVESIISDLHNYQDALDSLKDKVKKLRRGILEQLISLYYGNFGEAPEHFTDEQKAKWQSVDLILQRAESDISWWDSNLFSAGDSRNILLNIIHSIISQQQSKRNNKMNKYMAKMQEADKKLKDAGHDNSHIYAYDENGKPTGYYVAPVDMLA